MKSIRMRLWSGMMFLCAIVILLIFLFQIVFLDKFYTQMEINKVEKNIREIVSQIEDYQDINTALKASDLTEKIDQISYDKNMEVQIVSSDETLIYNTAKSGNKMPGMMQGEITNSIIFGLKGEEYTNQTIHRRFGNKIVVMGLPVYMGGEVKGAVALSFPLASVEDTSDILKKQLIIITFVILAVSIIMSSLMSKKFTKPILLISETAEIYSHGDFEKRLPELGKDETGQLARRMNQMGEALSRNEMLKRELISNVSHELRTPLTIIRGYAEALRDISGDDVEKRNKQLGVIIEQSKRLGIIVEDMLSLSKLQSGTESLKMEEFLVEGILEDIRMMYGVNNEKRTFIISESEGKNRNVIGDKRKIEQVLYNFISNAFVHTSSEHMVEVRLIELSDAMRVEVRDNGPGILKADIDHIFERYYKGAKTGDRFASGSGLGLAIVKGILELHKAPYGVESEPGNGSIFWFELPFS